MENYNMTDTDRLAGKICQFIWDNYDRSLPLQKVAEFQNISSRSCRRIISRVHVLIENLDENSKPEPGM